MLVDNPQLMVCVYLVFAWNNTYLEAGVGYALRIVFNPYRTNVENRVSS